MLTHKIPFHYHLLININDVSQRLNLLKHKIGLSSSWGTSWWTSLVYTSVMPSKGCSGSWHRSSDTRRWATVTHTAKRATVSVGECYPQSWSTHAELQIQSSSNGVLLLGKEQLAGMDLSVHVKGGGHTALWFSWPTSPPSKSGDLTIRNM